MSINLIESVQRRFTKRLPGYVSLDYDSRLTKLDLESLELRRMHLDLILVYKILFGLIDIDASDFFVFSNNVYGLRGHEFKLVGRQCRINTRQHFFTERVINPWNSLVAQAKDFSSLGSFRKCLKKNDLSQFITVL